MTTEMHKKAIALLGEIRELEEHVKRIEAIDFVNGNINIEGGCHRIPLYHECLPMPQGDFITMYLMKAKGLLSKLQEEFDNL
ncbi:MAG: hypothetical protein LBF55_07570 [Prevotellaceae bacterium]|jgi:hypothetical protein|nr:hypothetical protein [Prevotellaceae bacterium]